LALILRVKLLQAQITINILGWLQSLIERCFFKRFNPDRHIRLRSLFRCWIHRNWFQLVLREWGATLTCWELWLHDWLEIQEFLRWVTTRVMSSIALQRDSFLVILWKLRILVT